MVVLKSFASLAKIGGRLSVTENPKLVNFAGLLALSEAGAILVRGNAQGSELTITGPTTLSKVSGSIEIIGNQGLTSIDGFSGSPKVGLTVGADIAVLDNGASTVAVLGFTGLLEVGGAIRISGNVGVSVSGVAIIGGSRSVLGWY